MVGCRLVDPAVLASVIDRQPFGYFVREGGHQGRDVYIMAVFAVDDDNRACAITITRIRVGSFERTKNSTPAGHGGSPWPKSSSSPGSAAKKAVHAVRELEDLFNGPASVCE